MFDSKRKHHQHPERFGLADLHDVRRDFQQLRSSIQAHDPIATETAWVRCERWLVMDVPAIASLPAEQARPCENKAHNRARKG